MSKYIETPLVDFRKLAKLVARLLRVEIEKRDLQMKEIASKSGISPAMISQSLGSIPSNNEGVYRKIAHAIGLSDKQFEAIKQNAIQEHFGVQVADPDMDYALSSELGNNPEAVKEVQGFMQFVKQKYGIKK